MSALAPILERFEDHTITTLRDEFGNLWYRASDLAAPLGMTKSAIRHQISELEPSDKRVNPVHTSTGEKMATFISQEGLLQITFLSRKPEARRLRKFAAQLVVRYAKGEVIVPPHAADTVLLTQSDLRELFAAVNTLANAVTAFQGHLGPRVAVMPARTGLRSATEFPAWSMAEHHRMAKSGYGTAAEFLTRELGKRPAFGKASGLANRVAHYCTLHEIPVHRFWRSGGLRVYLHTDTLRLVHRTGWSAKNAIMAEAQMGLWGGEDKGVA